MLTPQSAQKLSDNIERLSNDQVIMICKEKAMKRQYVLKIDLIESKAKNWALSKDALF